MLILTSLSQSQPGKRSGLTCSSSPPCQAVATTYTCLVQVYLTGHGGNGFLKFQDREELTAGQLAAATARTRFRRLLLAVDTCQAASLPAALSTPGVVAIASSLAGAAQALAPASAVAACEREAVSEECGMHALLASAGGRRCISCSTTACSAGSDGDTAVHARYAVWVVCIPSPGRDSYSHHADEAVAHIHPA